MFNLKRILTLAVAAASAGTLIVTSSASAYAEENDELLSEEELIRQKEDERWADIEAHENDFTEFPVYDYTQLDPEFAKIATLFGDVNSDRLVGIADAVQLQRYLLGEIDELGNWFNADLNQDGVINAADFTILKQQICGVAKKKGGSAVINLVDMMTGDPIDGGYMQMYCIYDNSWSYEIAKWKNKAGEAAYFSGLPNDPKYVYYIEAYNLPRYSGYDNTYGISGQQFYFSFGEGETSKAVSVRLASDEDEKNPNVVLSQYDWAMEMDILNTSYNYGWFTIYDKDGNMYYPRLDEKGCSLPDGEYRAELHPYSEIWDDYSVIPVDPESDFAKHIRELHPEAELSNKSEGIEFTVQNGKADKVVSFDFGPRPDISDSIKINCFNGSNGKPLEGVVFSLIEAPDTSARKIETWVSDATGTHTFENLLRSGYGPDNHAYKVCVESVPTGFEGSFDQYFGSMHISGATMEYTFDFYEIDGPKLVSADIVKYGDNAVLNDAAAFTVYRFNPDNAADLTKIYNNVQAGEAFALRDGKYAACLDFAALKNQGYDGIDLFDAANADILAVLDENDFYGNTAFIQFTVKDGAPDRELKFYVRDYVPAET